VTSLMRGEAADDRWVRSKSESRVRMRKAIADRGSRIPIAVRDGCAASVAVRARARNHVADERITVTHRGDRPAVE
jgi:hypothetical protein